MKTNEEILTKLRDNDIFDFFGTRFDDLIPFLSFEQAKEFLKDEVTVEEFAKIGKPLTQEAVISELKEYMPFAWKKANNCRGLSAGRSINHMQNWLWLLGEDEAAKEIEHHQFYGKPQLRAICEKFGIDWKVLDDGEWRNDEMSKGAGPSETTIILPWKETVED